jgi:hypothetical protein
MLVIVAVRVTAYVTLMDSGQSKRSIQTALTSLRTSSSLLRLSVSFLSHQAQHHLLSTALFSLLRYQATRIAPVA